MLSLWRDKNALACGPDGLSSQERTSLHERRCYVTTAFIFIWSTYKGQERSHRYATYTVYHYATRGCGRGCPRLLRVANEGPGLSLHVLSGFKAQSSNLDCRNDLAQ